MLIPKDKEMWPSATTDTKRNYKFHFELAMPTSISILQFTQSEVD